MKHLVGACALVVIGCSKSPLAVDAGVPDAATMATAAAATSDAEPAISPQDAESDTFITAPATKPITAKTVGFPFNLRVEAGVITYCDKRGGRRFDPSTRRDEPLKRACPKDEGNTTCVGSPVPVVVSTPGRGPNDRVEYGDYARLMRGLVHDCAVDGDTLAIVTGSTVVTLDVQTNALRLLEDQDGGERVAIGSKLIAWADGAELRVQPR